MKSLRLASGLHELALSRLRSLGKEFGWIILGNAAAAFGAIVGIRVLTGFLDPKAYGQLALGMTVATLVNQTVLGPLGNGATRFYAPAVEKNDLASCLAAVRHLVLLATAAIAALMLIAAATLFIVQRSGWIPLTICASLFAILTGWNAILNGIQSAARQRSIVALHQGLEPWGRFLVAALLVSLFGTTSVIAITGYAVSVGLVLTSQLWFFQKTVPDAVDATPAKRQWQARIWEYSWPFVTWGVFGWAQQASDRWALQLFASTQEVGLYAALFQLGYYPISVVNGLVAQLLAPIFFERTGDATDLQRNATVTRLSWRLATSGLAVTVLAVLFALAFHQQLFRIFAAREYASVSHLLPWVVLGGGTFAVAQTIALNLMSQMKTRVMIAAKVATALAGIGFNFLLGYWYGITGVVCAGVLFSIFYLTWMVVIQMRSSAGWPSVADAGA
jgi:O-antigen/teichoic acid export membrane protein